MDMAAVNRSVALLVLMAEVVLLQLCQAAEYKVGDSAGWTSIGNLDYKQWAATKTFKVGDVIHFEYNPKFHNVMQVTHAMYRACNASAPLATFTTGNDSITITTQGHHLFICGTPGHCQAGQKVDINVLRTPVAAPAPSPSGKPSMAPAPSPNSASSLKAPAGIDHPKLGLAMAAFVVFVLGFA
ncbi:hypothetical protein SLE2022_170920 [Rubroshorea leprosula]|uniref:Phytocyanin domain-containing protein n=1 Tax=Rubroshorea leprosula TaxID=152421 RepID=A0AAV5M0C7_9ROSI|nr:hypothetical protein SLEP1_g50138 [Rubroshorea leprosula]